MPTMMTLLDIAKFNGHDRLVGLIDETIRAVPEVRMGDARTIAGIHYKTLVRTGLPGVSFRAANEGVTIAKGQYENRLVETFFLNPRWECDVMVADTYEDGPAAALAIEASGIMEGAVQLLGRQFYYGTQLDAKGFPGLNEMYDDVNMAIDAAGTTANTASSVWAVRFGAKDVQWVWGTNGNLALTDVTIQRVLDANSKPFSAYVQEMRARPGLQVGNKFAVGKIKNLTADSGKGLTDARLGALFAKFKVGYPPDVYFATRRSIEQLRASRLATNPTGAPVPYPTDYNGIPIVPTDSILETEAIV